MSEPVPTLEELGWGEAWEKHFLEDHRDGWEPARITIEDKHNYVVVSESGYFPAQIAGKLLHQCRSKAQLPKVGDWVSVLVIDEEEKAVIHRVLPRKTIISRKSAGRRNEEQVLASNVDKAFVVQALDQSFNPRLMERHILMVLEGGARPVVVLNKADLCANLPEALATAKSCSAGAEILVVSALTGEHIPDLGVHVGPGESVVFLGASGVGKSSLINRLYGEEIQPTIEVRESDAKGRHTTTWRELIALPGGGIVIDTPGMREFHLWFAEGGVHDAYPEIEELGVRCRFTNCSHISEKGCAVLEAVEAGSIPRERLLGYLKLRKELDNLQQAGAYRSTQERKRKEKIANRAMNRYQRFFTED